MLLRCLFGVGEMCGAARLMLSPLQTDEDLTQGWQHQLRGWRHLGERAWVRRLPVATRGGLCCGRSDAGSYRRLF